MRVESRCEKARNRMEWRLEGRQSPPCAVAPRKKKYKDNIIGFSIAWFVEDRRLLSVIKREIKPRYATKGYSKRRKSDRPTFQTLGNSVYLPGVRSMSSHHRHVNPNRYRLESIQFGSVRRDGYWSLSSYKL